MVSGIGVVSGAGVVNGAGVVSGAGPGSATKSVLQLLAKYQPIAYCL